MLELQRSRYVSPLMTGLLVSFSMLVAAFLGIGWLSMKALNARTQSIHKDVEVLVSTAATVIDIDKYKQLLAKDVVDQELYEELVDPLIDVHNAIPEVYYLYTMVAKEGREYFVLDTAMQKGEVKWERNLIPSLFMEEYKEGREGRKEMLSVIKQGEFFVFDEPYKDSYGTFMTGYAPIFDKDGSVISYLGADFDIADYSAGLIAIKKATGTSLALAALFSAFVGFVVMRLKKIADALEKKTRDAEVHFRSVVDNVPGAIFQWVVEKDDQYRFSYMSARCFDIFGFKAEDVMKDWEYLHIYPLDQTKFLKAMKSAVNKRAPHWTFEGRLLTQHDEVQWFRWVAKCEVQEDGCVFFNGIMLDITKEKSAEELLAKSRERLRQVIENNNLIDYNISFGGEMLYISHVCIDLLGYKPDELIGKSADYIIHEEDREHYNQALKRTHLKGGMARDIVYRVKHKNGSWLWFSSNISVVMDGNHQPVYFGGIAADISKRKQAEIEAESTKIALEQTNQEILAVNNQLEESISEARRFAKDAQVASKAKSDFLATMSHEIRTPLNSIIGFTSVLLNLNLNQEQLELVERVRSGGDNLLLLVNDILDFSKIESGALELEKSAFDVRMCLQEVKDLLIGNAKEKGLSLGVKSDGLKHGVVEGDVNRLRQILVNLVGNAIKFTEKGGVGLEVVSELVDPGKCKIRFSVTDSGIGMTQEQIDKLFRPFVQADSSTTRKFGGTGLGLVISRRLCDLMEGKVWVESEPLIGSQFFLEIPFVIREQKDVESEPVRAPNNKIERLADTYPIRILVADDNTTNQRVVGLFLDKMGYRADFASNGMEVIEAVGRQEYDLILMDVQMPEMDGLKATQLIRKDEIVDSKTPMFIVALTAFAMQGDQEKCMEAGMDAYLTKPIKIEHLAKVIKDYAKSRFPEK